MQKINSAPPVTYYTKYTKKQCKQIKVMDILTVTTKKCSLETFPLNDSGK